MVFIWIFPPVYLTVTGILSSDIIKGTCVPWAAYSSYATEQTVGLSILLTQYLLPLMTILCCYFRIVYTIRRKVSPTL